MASPKYAAVLSGLLTFEIDSETLLFAPEKQPVAVATEGCVAWRSENPSVALLAYVKIVEQLGRSIR